MLTISSQDPADMHGYLENWCIHLGRKVHGNKSPKIKSIWRKGVRFFFSFTPAVSKITKTVNLS